MTLAELKSTIERLGSLGDVETPPSFAEKVMQRVRQESGKKGFLRWLFYPLHIKLPAEAFAVAMVAVVAVYVFHAMSPEVAMQTAGLSEKQAVVSERPEADVAESDTFAHPADEKPHPFAPSKEKAVTEEEAEWAHEDISEQSGGEVTATEREQVMKMKREAPAVGLMKSEPAAEEFRAKEEPMLLRDAAAPSPEGEESMDRLASAETLYEAKAALPEPNVRLTLEVEDVAFARHELESAVTELGGKVVDEKGRPDNVIRAELGADALNKFLKKVEGVGEIKSKTVAVSGERVIASIELLEGAGP